MYHYWWVQFWFQAALMLLPLTLLAGFFVALVLTWHRHRHGNRDRTAQLLGSLKRFAQAASMLWMAFFSIALFMLYEPWPLSLRQGPDTEFAQSCYRRYLGAISQKSVSRIYCREERSPIWRHISSLRFSLRDTASLEKAIQRQHFAPVSVEDQSAVHYFPGPSWWPGYGHLSSITKVYKQRSLSFDWRGSVSFLWIHEEAGEAFFQRAT